MFFCQSFVSSSFTADNFSAEISDITDSATAALVSAAGALIAGQPFLRLLLLLP